MSPDWGRHSRAVRGRAGQGGREAEARQPACRAGGLLGGERGLQARLGWGPLGSTSAGAVVTQ